VKTEYPGIDYAGPGSTVNRNPETGLRYGIIPTNDVSPDALEDIWNNGEDEDFIAYRDEAHRILCEAIGGALDDYLSKGKICQVCDAAIEVIDEWLGDGYESTGDCTRYSYESDGYKLSTDSGGDLWIFDSPFYTRAQFCSPCAPGAGNLTNPCEDGPKTYCLGLGWFNEHNPCPYTGEIFRVSDNSKVELL
jgi:hypothetical protein